VLTLVVRRALVQWRLLTAVVVLIAVSASLVGICSLLLGVTQQRAFHVEVERAQPQDVDVTAYLVGVSGSDLVQAREQARRVVADVLDPMRPTVTSTATSRMRRLGDDDQLAYLEAGEAIAERADLTSGRWPDGSAAGPPEAAVPDTAARLLDLSVGDRVTLGSEIGLDGVDSSVIVKVVGTYRQQARVGWESDPLGGDGFDPAYSDGSVTAPAYGPFVVGDEAFLATGSTSTSVRVVAHPTLSLAEDSLLRDAVGSLDHASGLLSSRVDDRAEITRVASDLSLTLDRVHAQQASTRATVLVVLLLGTALSLAAALLAGWLVASVRDDERALLVALGLSRRQQVGAALAEALLVAVAAALLAVPAAAVAHSRLTQLADLRAAGLDQSPAVTPGLVVTVLAGAVLLALALVATALDTGTTTSLPGRRWAVARSGLDLLLLAAAGVTWWQLRSQPATTAAPGDVTLTLAPVLCLTAVTVVAVRLVPLLLAGAARAASRSRTLVLPLAAQQAARRSHAGTAMVLVAAAVAASVFGLALRTTWERSQDDQAALRVGSDLTLALPAPAGLREAASVVAAIDGSSREPVVSVAIDRPLALGRYVGEPGSRPVLVAVDTRQAGELLRGRLESGAGWSEVTADLAPAPPVGGVPLPDDGTEIQLEGVAPPGAALTMTPTAVVQDAAGFRSSVTAAPLPVDGRSHPVQWLDPIEPGLHLVAVRLDVDGGSDGDPNAELVAEVSLTLRIPGEPVATSSSWDVVAMGRDNPVRGVAVSVEPTAAGTEVRTKARVDLTYLAYTGAVVLATAFPVPTEVPVVVSQQLADAVGVGAGEAISAIVDNAALALRVTRIVPTVPSAPGQVAVLADADTLSRALIGGGWLEPVVDAWWVADPTPETVEALRALDIGDVTTRQDVAEELAQGPLRVTVPSALLTLVAAAVVLLLAGVGLVLSADLQRRAAEVTRLRALGLTRRDARRLLLLEHGAFLVPLVLVGALVGVVAAVTLGPLLIRSDLGAAPVPDAVVAWPWAAEGLLVGGLVLASLAITAVVTAFHVRRSDPAYLRAGDG